MLEKLRKYIDENLEDNYVLAASSSAPAVQSFVGRNAYSESPMESPICDELYEEEKFSLRKEKHNKKTSIDQYIEDNNDNNHFQTLLFKYIDDRNLKDSDVYNKVHIDRRLFSKIRSDKYYHPSKETIILLGISLELNEKEIEDLLVSASYYLPKNNYYDLIIRFCFKNKIYDLFEINNYLEEYDCKQFNF